MNLAMVSKLSKTVEKFAIDNSPTLLTGVGVIGVAATALLTAKASFIAAKRIEEKRFIEHLHDDNKIALTKNDALTKTQTFQLVWSCYIPPAVAGCVTIGAVVMANRINTKRAAAMAIAYSVLQNHTEEYKEKIVEKLGKGKEQQARDDIAQDHINRNPVGKNQIIMTGGGEVLCFDKYTGRYFMSSMDTLKKSENEINFQILNNGDTHLNDLYRMLGLPTVPVGEEVGWNREFNLELIYTTTMSEDNRPCIVVDYQVCGIRRRPSNGPSALRAIAQED